MKFSLRTLLGWIFLLAVGGCSAKPLDYVEVKRIDEVVTETELNDFLEVIQLLPDGKLPELPAIYRTPAAWGPNRTLPVSELVNEETSQIERPWDTKLLADGLETNRRLQRAIRRVAMTPEQFMGLYLAIGTAMNRSQMPEDFDFNGVVSRGQKVVKELAHNRTPFVDYSLDGQFSVSRDAMWLHRLDRANRLRDVPLENVALVKEHWEELTALFPREFTLDPLATISDPLEENGTPFEELPGTGSDDKIQWNPEDALIGTDVPETTSSSL